MVGAGDVNPFFSNDRSEESSMSVYLIQSFLNGDYMDVLGGTGKARAQLCLNPSNISLPSTWAPSQLWTLQPPVDEKFPGFPYPDPFPNSFYIASHLPVDASTQLPWVVDIRGKSTTAPAPVQLYPQKPSVVMVDRKTPLGPLCSWTFNSGVENQLWNRGARWREQVPHLLHPERTGSQLGYRSHGGRYQSRNIVAGQHKG